MLLVFLILWMHYVLEHPTNSIRDCKRDLGYSVSKIQRVLGNYKYHAYKYTKVQKLTELDMQRRLEFCQNLLQMLQENPEVLDNILWTDEAHFCTSGIPNLKNLHYWKTDNPRKTIQIKRSGRVSLGVWCGIIRNIIIGGIFYNGSLTGRRYLHILENDVAESIDELPLNITRNLIWQQDGAPCHNILEVRQFLNQNYNVWIGKHGTIRWPPNSPDLTPPDYFLWGNLKTIVYTQRPENIQEIQERIIQGINYINTRPEMIERAVRSLERRLRLCVQQNGGHFQHLLN